MKFIKTDIAGVFIVESRQIGDERGFFARTYCENEFIEQGLEYPVAQCNMSYSADAGTVRGLHYQSYPCAESKLVRCTHGSIYDVAVDVREGSETYGMHVGIELSRINRLALYVPKGFAHGYQTLQADAEVHYQVTAFYAPQNELGLRFDDPRLNIKWPHAVTTVSEKDTQWALLP